MKSIKIQINLNLTLDRKSIRFIRWCTRLMRMISKIILLPFKGLAYIFTLPMILYQKLSNKVKAVFISLGLFKHNHAGQKPKSNKWLFALMISLLTPLVIYAASLTKKHTFTGGQVISSSEVNENFDQLFETAARKNPSGNGIQFLDHVDVASFTINGATVGTATGTYWLKAVNDISYIAGNVGIGVGTPLTPLHVVGESTLSGNTSVTGDLSVSGNISGTFTGSVPAVNITGLAASDWKAGSSGIHYNATAATAKNIGIGIADEAGTRVLIRSEDASNSKVGLKVTDSNDLSLFYVRNDARVGVGVAGSEKFVITEAGKLGLGVTSPTTSMQVKPASGDSALLLETSSDANFAGLQVKGGPTSQTWSMGTQQDNLTNSLVFRNGAAGTEQMVLETGGDLGVGISDPLVKVHVAGAIRASNLTTPTDYVQIYHGGSNAYIDSVGAGKLQFRFGGSTKAYITPDGNADFDGDVQGRIKVPYMGGDLEVNTYNGGHRQISHSGYDLFIWKSSGCPDDCWVQMTSVATHGASDKRWKQNIKKVNGSLSKIIGLNGVNFEYKPSALKEYNFRKGKQAGFIAQEVEKVIPELVYNKSGFQDYRFIDYDKLTSYLVEAVKELKKEKDLEIASLKNENARLNERLNNIENHLTALGI